MMLLAIFVAFWVAAGLTRHFCNPVSRLHILDHPNQRSLHHRPIPRSGGIAVLAGTVAGGMVFYPAGIGLGIVLIMAIPVIVVSFLDDCFGVHAAIRLLAHFLAAVLLIGTGYGPNQISVLGPSWTLPPLAMFSMQVLFVVWMINLFNFMDGMDGFAGGMAVIGFTAFAILGRQAGDPLFGIASLLVAAAAAGFLWFNFPPARIFLGDTGSSLLGFLAAVFSLWASREGLFPLWVSILIFSPFISDATVTLIRRLLGGKKVWQPHKTHYYQRLVQMGWGHRRTVLIAYLLMLSCSLSALLAMQLSGAAQLGLASVWLLTYALMMIGIEHLERAGTKVMPP